MKDFETKKSAIQSIIENLDDKTLCDVHNTYCENAHFYEDMIYDNSDEEFDEFFADEKPSEIARKVSYGDYSFTDPYFIMDGYANLKSGYVTDFVYPSDIAKYVILNDDALDNDEIQEQLDEWADEEAEEENSEDEE